MELDQRKKQRLRDYDYSQNGAYYITLCTREKQHLFGTVNNGCVVLNMAGEMVRHHLEYIDTYENVILDKYVIMPNHIHAIINTNDCGTTYPIRGTGGGRSLRYRSIYSDSKQ